LLASIALEERGIPALALCTEAFTGSLTALTSIYGRPDKTWARIPHPFGSLTPDEVRQRAEFLVAEFYRAVLVDG
jgi:hypothetical protein